jgi:lycopene cyclase CruA
VNEREAWARVRDAGGDALAERLAHLDALRAATARPQDEVLAPPDAAHRVDADVIVAGGGLSLLIAAALAGMGVRVIVIDRARVGAAHREWNASAPELEALVAGGIATRDELDAMVVAAYARGVCAFHGSTPTVVTGVLDRAVDAGPLLDHTRALALSRGATLLDGHSVVGLGGGANGVSVRARDAAGGSVELTARVVLDARGAASPSARADLVCPTVGGVLRGLAEGNGPDEIDPATGEILVTNEPADAGRQHVWEAFPGRKGETTVYAFYYARAGEEGSLLSLFARFFATLPAYKRGAAELVRPTFGYIPAWSRLVSPPRPPCDRVVLVGDAAARHSPLTMCGFGSMLRSFAPAARAVAGAIERGTPPVTDGGALAADAPIHRLTGGLALLMASPQRDPNALNELLAAAFASLAALGNDTYAALLRDEISAADFTRFLRGVGARRPQVYGEVLRTMPLRALSRWGFQMARELARVR